MMTVQQLCRHITKLIHCPIRVYNADGKQTAFYIDNGEQQDVFDNDQEFLGFLLTKRNPGKPVIFFEAQKIIYGLYGDEKDMYIIGPCSLDGDEITMANYLIKRHKMNLSKPYRIYRVALDTFIEIVLMLYEAQSGEAISRRELIKNSFCDDEFHARMNQNMNNVLFELREQSVVHNPYSQEIREQESIKNGDLESLRKSFTETYIGEIGTLSKDTLRQIQSMAAVVVTLASRSAIEGGLLPEIAFSMSDAFIQQANEMNNIGEIAALIRLAEEEYCRAVHELNASASQKPLIIRCKELIVQQLHSKISIRYLANELNINADYLSQLFVKEEGINLSDYIAREKVRAAKRQLAYTDDSYVKISSSLGFSSQSHFGKTFKKWTDMTPKQYREKIRKNG